MATQLYFSRDTKVYIEFNNKVWEIPVLDGFSFSQGNNTSEITLSEMESSGGVSRRGRRAFNDSLAAGEWSFSTYVRPFTAASGSADGTADAAAEVHAVEEVLWAMLAGADQYNGTDYNFERGDDASNVNVPAAAQNAWNFTYSNKSTLGTANMYFVLGNTAKRNVVKLKGAVVAEASVDFEIDGIATINWTGQCSEVIDFTGSTIEAATTVPQSTTTTNDGTAIAVGDVWLDTDDYKLYVMTDVGSSSEAATPHPINEGITDTDNFIRNRLTTLAVNGANTTGLLSGTNAYDMTLTGGNITISNNITYITPEELGLVNVPVGHVTGTRSVSGSFTCYLSMDDSAVDGSGTKSRDFFEDLRNLTTTVTNSVSLTFSIGGGSGKRLEMVFPTTHIEIPTHSIEDVISLETNFQALPSTIDGTNEMTFTYKV